VSLAHVVGECGHLLAMRARSRGLTIHDVFETDMPDGKKGFRSYGSMTYAGLKSMIYAGVKPSVYCERMSMNTASYAAARSPVIEIVTFVPFGKPFGSELVHVP
jgi:hypothetical protein